jgi:hypothetical protein
MTIREVLKRENLGKKYRWNKAIWMVTEEYGDHLNLVGQEFWSYIETKYFLDEIANADFEEIN